jgi:peptidoglycan/xylan/chitin deacetylase (PgdA/CDA1 family)
LEWRNSGGGLPRKPILITFDDAYADITEHALPILRHFGFSAAVFAVTARIGQTSNWDASRGYTTLPLMSAEQIRYWAEQGIEFGAHSRTHADLTTLSTDALFEEIVTSRNELAALVNRPAIAFAYPFGAYNDAALGIVQSNFDLAFTFNLNNGFNCRETDPHLLRRVLVRSNQSMLAFSLLVRMGFNWRSKLALRTRLKRVKSMYRSGFIAVIVPLTHPHEGAAPPQRRSI